MGAGEALSHTETLISVSPATPLGALLSGNGSSNLPLLSLQLPRVAPMRQGTDGHLRARSQGHIQGRFQSSEEDLRRPHNNRNQSCHV